eukprot:Gb_25761 [translate_table: standard]
MLAAAPIRGTLCSTRMKFKFSAIQSWHLPIGSQPFWCGAQLTQWPSSLSRLVKSSEFCLPEGKIQRNQWGSLYMDTTTICGTTSDHTDQSKGKSTKQQFKNPVFGASNTRVMHGKAQWAGSYRPISGLGLKKDEASPTKASPLGTENQLLFGLLKGSFAEDSRLVHAKTPHNLRVLLGNQTLKLYCLSRLVYAANNLQHVAVCNWLNVPSKAQEPIARCHVL